MTRALYLGQAPKELQFFHEGESKAIGERLYSLGLDDSNIKFADYLMFKECRALLKRNKMFIHIEIGNIFFKNMNNRESLYHLFYAQQDYSKKLLEMELVFSTDYKAYVFEYLIAIKFTNDDKYNMLTNMQYLNT